MNDLVQEYRKRVTNDPRSDEELTLQFGQAHDTDGRYANFPSFIADYNALKQARVEDVPISSELRRGLSRGVESLKESAYGIGALGADVVGADSVRDWMLKKYNESGQSAAEEAPGVARVEDINSPSTAVRWALGKAGEFIPMVGEAVAMGAAGAVAGSAIGPEGTAAGGAAGLTEGFFARQAAKSLIKTGIRDIIGKTVSESAISAAESQIKKVAAGEAVEALSPAAKELLSRQIPALAKQYGVKAVEALNFGAISAGASYGHLVQEKDVTPEDARWAAVIAGIGGAAPALVPGAIAEKLFPGLSAAKVDSLTTRILKQSAAQVPIATGAMTVMEAANIAAERYAKDKSGPLTDEELSRMLNAGVTGAAVGVVGGIIGGIPSQKTFDPAVERHFSEVSKQDRLRIAALKTREELGTLSDSDHATLRTMTGPERAFAAVFETMTREQRNEYIAETTSREEPKQPQSTAAEATPTAGTAATVPASDVKAASTVKPLDPTAAAARAKVDAAAAKTDTNPTEAQKQSGNYAKGKVSIDGLQISIENPKGSERKGKDASGKEWSVTMPADYGYILGTKGRDKDHVDVYIGPNPTADRVFIVDQIDPRTGKFDEHKTMLGFETEAQALAAYDSAFSDSSGPSRRGAVTDISKDNFKAWLKEGNTKEPYAFKEKGGVEHGNEEKGKKEGLLTSSSKADKEQGTSPAEMKTQPVTPAIPDFKSPLTADDKSAREAESATGFTLIKKNQVNATEIPTPEKWAMMDDETRALYTKILESAKPEWEFTDRRAGSPTEGRTFRAPVDATLDQMLEAHKAVTPDLKPKDQNANSQQSTVEKTGSSEAGSPAPVSEGKPGEVQPVAGAGEAKAGTPNEASPEAVTARVPKELQRKIVVVEGVGRLTARIAEKKINERISILESLIKCLGGAA